MKKAVVLPLVAAIAGTLVGCGGSSSGSSSPKPTSYTWQMVELYKTERSQVSPGCAVLALDEKDSSQAYAARVADRGFRILFHRADGSVEQAQVIDQIPANGRVSILKDNIPDDGYVTLEEYLGFVAGKLSTYSFSVHKDFMSDMTLAVRNLQSSRNDCLKGEQVSAEDINPHAAISAVANGTPKYYQTSSSGERIAGAVGPFDIPIIADPAYRESKLVTAFNEMVDGQPQEVIGYSIFSNDLIYDSSVSQGEIIRADDENLAPSYLNMVDLNVDNQSSVQVALGNKVYSWQPVIESTGSITFAETDGLLSLWNINLIGRTKESKGSWLYVADKRLEPGATTITSPHVEDFSSADISPCGTKYCVDTSGTFAPRDFGIQRTAVRSTNNNGDDFYQTIYSYPTNEQVILNSYTETLYPSGDDRIEVALVSSAELTLSDSFKNLTNRSFDLKNHVDMGDAAFADFNGAVFLPTEANNIHLRAMEVDVEYVANSNQ
ncbi:hypothetical protein [Vibrio sp. WXL103]|uniref:hypothetical protein n=1 Tax=Vibrio sp. WXL103 TaxID=3450710 RepID=UPI003EC613FB